MAQKTRFAGICSIIICSQDRVSLRWILNSGVALALALSFSSCATKPASPPPAEPKKFSLYEWNGDGVKGNSSVIIYLDQQKAYYYRDGKQVGWTYVATGTSRHPTRTGQFNVMEKVLDKISNLYGIAVDANGDVVDSDFDTRTDSLPEGAQFRPAKMPLYMRLTGDGVGMHVGKIPNPGRPASHGCIRMPRYMAEKFYANLSIGTPVAIVANTPTETKSDVKKKRF